jgi:hypothetical protein
MAVRYSSGANGAKLGPGHARAETVSDAICQCQESSPGLQGSNRREAEDAFWIAQGIALVKGTTRPALIAQIEMNLQV